MKPWETYKSDVSIDLKKHHVPKTLMDKIAYWTVKSLRWPTDLFFQVYTTTTTPHIDIFFLWVNPTHRFLNVILNCVCVYIYIKQIVVGCC